MASFRCRRASFPFDSLCLALAALLGLAAGGCAGGGGSGGGALGGTWRIDTQKSAGSSLGQLDKTGKDALAGVTYTFQGMSKSDKTSAPELGEYDGYYYVSQNGKPGGEAGVYKGVGGGVYNMFSGNPNVNDRVKPSGQLTLKNGVATWTPKLGDFAGMQLTLRKK